MKINMKIKKIKFWVKICHARIMWKLGKSVNNANYVGDSRGKVIVTIKPEKVN